MNENEGKVDAKEIKRLINNPMSNVDIIKRLGGRTKVLMYDEFKKFDTLEDAMRPWDNLVFLLRTEEDFGHWMAIKRTLIGSRSLIRTGIFRTFRKSM